MRSRNQILEDVVDTTFVKIGAPTLIVQTIGINTNAKTMSELVIANRRIWEYAIAFESKMVANSTIASSIGDGPATTTTHKTKMKTRQIFVMDIFAYSVTLFLHQSMEIGLISRDFGNELRNKMDNAADYDEYLNLTMSLSEAYNHTSRFSVKGIIHYRKDGHFCADKDCNTASIVSADGMHWCIDEMGERMNAAIACLTTCSLKEGQRNVTRKRLCERYCNELYMNISTVTSAK